MTTRLNKTVQFLFLFLIAGIVQSQSSGVQVSSGVDKSRITIGDLIVYSVRMSHPANVEVDMPGPGANLGGFEIRDYSVKDPRREDNSIVSEAEYVISTFLTGEFTIPPLTLYYRTERDTLVKSISTEKIKIVVESMKASEAGDIRDIKPPKEIPRDWRTIILLSSLGLLVILMVIAGIIIYRRRKAGQSIIPVKTVPPRPPHEIAYEAIKLLRESGLLEAGKIKQYYIELSDIIRRYIEGRYYLIALEMTTYEVLRDLSTVDISVENLNRFKLFLDSSDLVKFAKKIPSSKENEKILNDAVDIIDQTKIMSLSNERSHEETDSNIPEDENSDLENEEEGR